MFQIKGPHTQNVSVYYNFTFSTNVAFIGYWPEEGPWCLVFLFVCFSILSKIN